MQPTRVFLESSQRDLSIGAKLFFFCSTFPTFFGVVGEVESSSFRGFQVSLRGIGEKRVVLLGARCVSNWYTNVHF